MKFEEALAAARKGAHIRLADREDGLWYRLSGQSLLSLTTGSRLNVDVLLNCEFDVRTNVVLRAQYLVEMDNSPPFLTTALLTEEEAESYIRAGYRTTRLKETEREFVR